MAYKEFSTEIFLDVFNSEEEADAKLHNYSILSNKGGKVYAYLVLWGDDYAAYENGSLMVNNLGDVIKL